jgi:hypothetical protein
MVSAQQQRLMDAARQSGITIEDLSAAWSQDVVKYSLSGQSEVVFEGALLGSSTFLGATICQDLPITRNYASQLGIPTPNSKVFKLESEQTSKEQLLSLLGDFWVPGKSYTCMPAFSIEGHGTASHIADLADLEIHIDTFADDYATWILEEQTEGEDLQILVIGGELASGVIRSALKLTGDGIKTLEEMIDAHNANASDDQIVAIDAETRQLLRDQDVFLSEPVPLGRSIQVKNPSAGAGGATDVTGTLNQTYSEWAAKISNSTGLRVFSMSFRCKSPSSNPKEGAYLLSLNAKPNWLSFESADGNKQDFAKAMLRIMFPGKLA